MTDAVQLRVDQAPHRPIQPGPPDPRGRGPGRAHVPPHASPSRWPTSTTTDLFDAAPGRCPHRLHPARRARRAGHRPGVPPHHHPGHVHRRPQARPGHAGQGDRRGGHRPVHRNRGHGALVRAGQRRAHEPRGWTSRWRAGPRPGPSPARSSSSRSTAWSVSASARSSEPPPGRSRSSSCGRSSSSRSSGGIFPRVGRWLPFSAGEQLPTAPRSSPDVDRRAVPPRRWPLVRGVRAGLLVVGTALVTRRDA